MTTSFGTITIQIDGLIHISEDGTENVVGIEPVRAVAHRTSYFQEEGKAEETAIEHVLPFDATQWNDFMPRRRLNNLVAVEGVDRCTCGAKYFENDTCVDCGNKVLTHINGEPVFAF